MSDVIDCKNGTVCDEFLITTDTCVEYVDIGPTATCNFPCSKEGCKEVVVFDETYCTIFICSTPNHPTDFSYYIPWILFPICMLVATIIYFSWKRYTRRKYDI